MDIKLNTICRADALTYCRSLPDACADMIITSPPYFQQRDYGAVGQIGLESTVEKYMRRILRITKEWIRVLRLRGSLYLNLGDKYANKGLLGIPWRLALRMMCDQEWILRDDIIWAKPNPKPNSVKDRFASAHEYIFLFVKNRIPYFNADAVRIPYSRQTMKRIQRAARTMKEITSGKHDPFGHAEDPSRILHNMARRWQEGKLLGKIPTDIWTVATSQFKGPHYATYPEQLCRLPILASCPPGGTVLDCFAGAGTTAVAASKLGRNFLSCDINGDYVKLAQARLAELKTSP